MIRAEDRALEKYPLMPNDDKEGLEALKYIGMECECASEYNEVQEMKQAYFIEGYHQAEKDLELTWEDVRRIYLIVNSTMNDVGMDNLTDKSIYQEVLKRFKNLKK